MTGLKKTIDPEKIIEDIYKDYPRAHGFLLSHSRMVAKKAVETARIVGHLNPDMEFIYEAAMLHDIGIYLTDAPRLGCLGDKPYICHGWLGRQILDNLGLTRHAVVCETHVGVGLTAEDIRQNGFPIPQRDMIPTTIEEIIVCFADKFFSKDNEPLKEKPIEKVRAFIGGFGGDKLQVFDGWLRLFGYGDY